MSKDKFEALERLIAGKPQRIFHPYKINKDTVALEAGLKRGSIKKSRKSHQSIIEAIEKAQKEGINPKPTKKAIGRARNEALHLKQMIEEGLNREIMLRRRNRDLEIELSKKVT